MVSDKFDLVIIGGGIVGLAFAFEFLSKFPRYKVALVEKETELALHQTGNNSGVIHSGLYYRPGTQKAEFCTVGAKLLKDFCDQNGINYRMPGKLVIANDNSDIPNLLALYDRGIANGLEGLEVLDQHELNKIEPEVRGVMAIHCPSAGIINYREVANVMAARAQQNGLQVFLAAEVLGIEHRVDSMCIQTSLGNVQTKFLVNCAGLHADRIMEMEGCRSDIRIIPFRGEYYSVRPSKQRIVRKLIYPVPDPRFPFLGVHFTPRITGGLEAGPNAVLAMAKEGYTKGSVNLNEIGELLRFPGFWLMAGKYWKTGIGELYRSYSKNAFTRALQKLVPSITAQDLEVAGSGVRAQAVTKQGVLVDDFRVFTNNTVIHVQNAPSPAATSSMAIAKHILKLAEESFGV